MEFTRKDTLGSIIVTENVQALLTLLAYRYRCARSSSITEITHVQKQTHYPVEVCFASLANVVFIDVKKQRTSPPSWRVRLQTQQTVKAAVVASPQNDRCHV